MFSDFPAGERIPWQVLIRARTEYDVTLVTAAVVARAVAGQASVDLVRQVASIVREVGPRPEDSKPMEPGQHLDSLRAFVEFDQLCPPPWNPKGPHPVFDDYGDALSFVVAAAALTLTAAVGGESLGGLPQVLTDMGQR